MVTLLKRPRSPWADLDAPWPTCFDLAWEAYRAGTIPVGAVVTDGDGRIVGRGRNRTHDLTAPAGRICSSPLAHAEIDALLALSPESRYEGHTLWTTVEPCLLCMGATITAAVGSVRWAAADVYAGATTAHCDNPHTARLPLGGGGPLPEPVGLVGAVLHLEPFVRNNAGGGVATAHRQHAPAVYEAASRLVAADTLVKASMRRAPFSEVADSILAALG
jgi:tRNA(Arg) A34 adenosine deaminase TadA